MFRIAFICLSFFLTYSGLRGQIVVQDIDPYSGNLNAVLEQYFFGDGIKVSNAEFKGVDVQFGVFTSAIDDLGYAEGIVLSTGKVKDVVGLNDTASSILTGQANRVDFDADLKQLADFMVDTLDRIHTGSSFERVESMIEAAILEFDVSTFGTELSFEYIFGSEEYSAWINTRFVDVMGIFVSGPGIVGPYSNNAINIAELPGGRLPLSVSSVHGGNANYAPFNEMYYVPTVTQNIAFGGITSPLKNKIGVSPCTTYHVKIAIADGSLPDKDSGIFLKKQGLNSNNIKTRLLEQAAVSFQDSLYQEGCALVAVELQFPEINVSTTYFQNFAFGSVADDLDINYETSFSQRATDRVDTVYYAINYDPFAEGKELAKFELKNTSGCVISSKPIEFYIQDRPNLTPNEAENDTLFFSCENVGVKLSVASNYSSDLRYAWSTNVPEENRKDSVVYVIPQIDEEQFIVTVLDTCSSQSFEKTFVVLKVDSDPVSFDFNDANPSISCKGESFQPSVTIQGGTAPYEYTVNFDGQKHTDSLVTPINIDQDGRYVLEVVDACGQTHSDSIELRVPNHASLAFSVEAPNSICPNSFWEVVTSISGGDGNYSTNYNGVVYQADTLRIELDDEFSFVFEATDGCGQVVSQSLEVTVDPVSADFELNYINDNTVQCINYSTNASNYSWYQNGELFSNEEEPRVELGIDEELILFLEATNANGCQDTLSKSIEPAPRYYIPTAFTPDNDGINDCFKPVGLVPEEYELTVIDRWGKKVFSTTNWSTCWDGSHPNSGEKISGIYSINMFVRYKNLKNTFTGIIQVIN
jgi:gliding motility-associated-like protein